ncbi:hypothetical protein [Streptomyces sp. NPDC054804]
MTGSFAVAARPLTVYGQAQGDQVTVLYPAAVPDVPGSVAASMPAAVATGRERARTDFGLLLVGWCHARLGALDIGGLLEPA